jgi:adenosine/AMP kinase
MAKTLIPASASGAVSEARTPTTENGIAPKGVEDEGEIKWRKDFLRKIGYKL